MRLVTRVASPWRMRMFSALVARIEARITRKASAAKNCHAQSICAPSMNQAIGASARQDAANWMNAPAFRSVFGQKVFW